MSKNKRGGKIFIIILLCVLNLSAIALGSYILLAPEGKEGLAKESVERSELRPQTDSSKPTPLPPKRDRDVDNPPTTPIKTDDMEAEAKADEILENPPMLEEETPSYLAEEAKEEDVETVAEETPISENSEEALNANEVLPDSEIKEETEETEAVEASSEETTTPITEEAKAESDSESDKASVVPVESTTEETRVKHNSFSFGLYPYGIMVNDRLSYNDAIGSYASTFGFGGFINYDWEASEHFMLGIHSSISYFDTSAKASIGLPYYYEIPLTLNPTVTFKVADNVKAFLTLGIGASINNRESYSLLANAALGIRARVSNNLGLVLDLVDVGVTIPFRDFGQESAIMTYSIKVLGVGISLYL